MPTMWDSNSHRVQSQLAADQILHSSCDYQRLRYTAQRREGELLTRVANCAGSKIHHDLIARDDGLLFARYSVGKPRAQPVHQLGRLDAQKAVVKGVTQIRLRETARDHQRDTFVFERGHRLLTAGASPEVESTDDHIARPRAPAELRIVVLHHHPRHHLRRHVLAIGVILAVDAVGIEIVLRQEDQSPANAGRESWEDLDLLGGSGTQGKLLEPPRYRVGSRFAWSADVACDCRRGDHLGAGQITLRIARAHASFEIAIGRRYANLAGLKQARTQADARSATRGQRMGAGLQEYLPDAALFCFGLHRAAGRGHIELHACSYFLAPQHLRRSFKIFQPRVYARHQIRPLYRNFLLGDLGDRLHYLHRVRPGDIRGDLGEIEHDACGIGSVGVGNGWTPPPLGEFLLGNASHAACAQGTIASFQIRERDLVNRKPAYQSAPFRGHVRNRQTCVHAERGNAWSG